MQNKVLTSAGLNQLEKAEAEIQEKINALGPEWEIVSAHSEGIAYKGGESCQESGPYHGNTHIMYIVTVAMKKVR